MQARSDGAGTSVAAVVVMRSGWVRVYLEDRTKSLKDRFGVVREESRMMATGRMKLLSRWDGEG